MSNETTAAEPHALEKFAGMGGPSDAPAPAVIHGQVITPSRSLGAQAVAVRRDEGQIMRQLKALAAAAGDDWFYRFPVKNKAAGTTTFIEGPTIKLANNVARIYGNCEIDVITQDLGTEWLFTARFTDFETGFVMTRPFQQRKNQASIKGDADRARDIAMQIGASKAIRNVIVNALEIFCDFAFAEARSSLVERIGKELPKYRIRVADRLAQNDIDIERAEKVVGRALDEWTAPDVARVIAMAKAVQDGMSTWGETFPVIAAEGDQDGDRDENAEQVDKFAKSAGPDEDGAAKGKKADQGAAKKADPKPDEKAAQADADKPKEEGKEKAADDTGGKAASEEKSKQADPGI